MILALLIAAAPPSSAYLQIRDHGSDAGYARILDCEGAYVSCTVDQTTNLVTLSVPSFDAGTFSGVGACSAHQFASTLNKSTAPTCTQPSQADLSGTRKLTGSNATNSTVTPATTGISWSIAAGVEQGFYCVVTSSGTSTSLATFNINGPPGYAVSFSTSRYTTTSATTPLVLQAFSAAAQTAACTTSCNTSQLPTYVFGTILADAGTVDLQFASSTAAQAVTVYRGSYCEVF